MIQAISDLRIGEVDQEPGERRWTREEYYRLIELGFFEGERVELVEGSIIQMAPQRVSHCVALELVDRFVRRAFGKGFRMRIQSPFRAGDGSDPEPDVAVIAGDDPRASSEHPSSAVLIIEISDTTIRHDRRKARLYAASGVGEYWILNLRTRSLELHRDVLPGGGPADGPAYGSMRIIIATQPVAATAAPDESVSVGDLLP